MSPATSIRTPNGVGCIERMAARLHACFSDWRSLVWAAVV
jgi:hypothetical protein